MMATTLLCPMCGRPVHTVRGRIASHRSYSWNQEGTRLMPCQATNREPGNVERAMTPELRAHYREERLAFLQQQDDQ